MSDEFEQSYLVSKFGGLPTSGWDWNVSMPEWLLDRLIPAKSIGMLFGPSNSGKSHLITDLILACLEDAPDWQGHELAGGPVVMFSESIGHIRARLKAYRNHRRNEIKHTLHCFPSMGLSMVDLVFLLEWLSKLPKAPSLLVFDTLATSFSIEENDNKEASQLIKTLEEHILPVLAPKAAIVIVHHTSKASGGTSARGASALIGNIDWSVNVQWDKDLGKTVAAWDKDRWRLVEDSPLWAGTAARVPVKFTNGETDMMVLDWAEHDPKAAEAAEELAKDKALEDAQFDFVKAGQAMIEQHRSFFFRTSPNAKPPAAMQAVQLKVGDFAEKDNQAALRAWVIEKMAAFDRAPVYNKGTKEIGILFTARGSN